MFATTPKGDGNVDATESDGSLRRASIASSIASDRSDASDFGHVRHGLLSINIVKAKVKQLNETNLITYIPILGAMALLFTCDIYYITVRVIQVKKHMTEPAG